VRLFLTKKSAQVIIFCLTLFGVFSFQNCSQHSFDVQKTTQKMDLSSTSSTSSSDQSVNTGTDQLVLVPQCSPQQSQACVDGKGHGVQYCDAAGNKLKCQIESCDPGYVLMSGSCAALQCQPGTMITCSENNGSGTQTCLSSGAGFGSCQINACNTGYSLQNGNCVKLACTAGSTTACAINNGSGVQTCISNGAGYGACVLSSCNAGFNMQNGQCVANACTPGSKTACAVNNGTGLKTCNTSGTGYGACTLSSCSSGYTLQNGLCVMNACVPGSTSGCLTANGSGSQICNSSGTGYGACVANNCYTGYTLINGVCQQNACKPFSTQACSAENGTGQRVCNSIGTDYSSCQISACNSGYTLQNGLCVIMPAATPIKTVDDGAATRCTLMSTGAVQCSGDNIFGDLGNGTCGVASAAPVTVLSRDVKDISASLGTICALVNDSVKCWGANHWYNLISIFPYDCPSSITSISTSSKPVTIISSGASSISLSDVGGCAVVNGSQVCWKR